MMPTGIAGSRRWHTATKPCSPGAFHHGDHVCVLFSNGEEPESVAAQFVSNPPR
jgi:hypothetical protein